MACIQITFYIFVVHLKTSCRVRFVPVGLHLGLLKHIYRIELNE